MTNRKKYSQLIKLSTEARNNAHAPHSNFRVGAAIEGKSGKIYSAFNIEVSSYGLSMCAERIAIWKAISLGEKEFKRIALVSDARDFCTPCGACRQVLYELAGDIEIIMTNGDNEIEVKRLSQLLPEAFTSETLYNGRS
ncbi:MAG: cytidine deaminase [Candidatus Kryptoniota bacterium]